MILLPHHTDIPISLFLLTPQLSPFSLKRKIFFDQRAVQAPGKIPNRSHEIRIREQ